MKQNGQKQVMTTYTLSFCKFALKKKPKRKHVNKI